MGNWTTDFDALDELGELVIEAGFEYNPFRQMNCFPPEGTLREFGSARPLFYLIRRGGGAGCLDMALKQRALNAGVEIRFGETRHWLPAGGVVTQGPRHADPIASGYLFETDIADGAYAAIPHQLAPRGSSDSGIWLE